MSNRKELLLKIVLTAVFSALVFALTYVSIPLPTGAKVHLGNFACVLAGLLLGGLVGGISGSLGMGFNDIAQGYGWDTILRTFIVKFILGYSVGLLFRVLISKDKKSKILLGSLAGIFLVGFVVSTIAYINGDAYYNKKKELVSTSRGFTINIFGTTKIVELSILVPIFLGITALIIGAIVIFFIFKKNIDERKKSVYEAVATVTAISVIINTAGEFVLRWFLSGIALASFDASFANSIAKLPANLITGVATIIFVTIIYLPVYLALHHAGFDDVIIHSIENDEVIINENNEEIEKVEA